MLYPEDFATDEEYNRYKNGTMGDYADDMDGYDDAEEVELPCT